MITLQRDIRELVQDHENISIFLREQNDPFAEQYRDAGTSDFITELLGRHEKTAYFLRSHLK